MAKVWLQALTNCTVDEAGRRVTYGPAQWFECGKHDARSFVATGAAKFANSNDQAKVLDLYDCGISTETRPFPLLDGIASKYHLSITQSEAVEIPYPRTLFLCQDASLNEMLVPVGFAHLDAGWQLAIPVCAGELLAENVGSNEDRAETLERARNLTVPLPDTRVMFVARCSETKRLLVEWAREKSVVPGGDPRLAFLRAYYRVKPVTCHLPAERWTE